MLSLLVGLFIFPALLLADFYSSGQTGLTNPYLIPPHDTPGPSGQGVTQYLVFHGKLAANFTSARTRCLALGGDLADVESVETLNYLASRLHQPAYVASWLGSHLGYACMAVFPGGAIAVPEEGCLGVLSNICEVPIFGTASIHIGVDLAGKDKEDLDKDFPDAKLVMGKRERPVENADGVLIRRHGKQVTATKAARTATMTIYGSIATNPVLPCCKCP